MLRQGEKTGQPIILFRQANFDPALDWTVAFQGLTSDFLAAGLVSLRWRCTTAARRRSYGLQLPERQCTNKHALPG